MYGYTAAEVVGQPILVIVPPERADEVADVLLQVHESKRVQHLDTQRVRKDGTVIDVALTVSPVLDAEGNLIGVSTIARDVGDRKRAEAALRESEARFRSAFEGTPIGMALLSGRPDGDALVAEANQSWCELLDHDPAAEPGRRLSSWLHPDGRDSTLAELSRLRLPGVEQVQFETRLVARGDTIWVILACSKTGLHNESDDDHPNGLDALWVMHVQDITAHKRAESQLTERTLHDPLTGLPNRVLLLDRLEAALARSYRRDEALALLFIDVDNFKVVNDSLGHDAGDALLVEIAKRLRETVRDTDTAARLGGDEYMVLCEDTDHAAVLDISARIGAAMREPFSIDGRNLHVTASIGIAMLPHGGGPDSRPVLADQLMRDADLAMYQAKRNGKNRYETFDRGLRTRAVARLEVECELRAAIDDGDLRVHYQPIVSLESGRVDGFEALVRWQHSDRGLLEPSEFLEIAEETDLIVPLGEFVLEQACHQLATWQQRYGPDLSMAINVSVRQLYRAEFPVVLARTLGATKVAAKSVHLEITETVLMDVTASTMHQIEAIERLGVELVIDDFGTGYSSLLYLKRLPVRGLKIDRSFVDGVMENPEDRAIVEAIVQLGGALDLHVVGEGVETIEQLSTLRSLGCRQVQGYLLGKPATADEIETMLAANPPLRRVSA
jgi:diguanylate cyclase (GGDEF)-like protein/PAS domain S-box-containing protein